MNNNDELDDSVPLTISQLIKQLQTIADKTDPDLPVLVFNIMTKKFNTIWSCGHKFKDDDTSLLGKPYALIGINAEECEF